MHGPTACPPFTLASIISKKEGPSQSKLAALENYFASDARSSNCFLIKQETATQKSLEQVLKTATARADELRSFDVIGLTEKGLGKSPLERMVRIAKLRRALDEAKVVSPIHVFGSLDPVSITLYFLAGAEIFDGLTWLRYAFVKETGSFKDQCAYIHGFATFEHGVHMDDKNQRLRVVTDNYYYLLDLTERLKHFESNGNFAKLPHPEFMRDASEKLQRELKK